MFLHSAGNGNVKHVGSFQEVMKPVLMIAQIFALMPVRGIGSPFADDLVFTWLSLRTCYAFLVLLAFGTTCGFVLAFATHTPLNFDSVETVIFYISIFLIATTFFQLARKWPAIALEWQTVESKLPDLGTDRVRRSLTRQVNMIVLVAVICSIVEHLLNIWSISHYVVKCPVFQNRPLDSYLHSNFNAVFYFVNYNTILGVVGKLINLLSTFAWSFNDIFVMTISAALAARFRQLNDYMEREARLPTTVELWIRCRINFRNLCKLCDTLDDAISSITMLCFSNNLYFICGKILKSMQKKPSIAHTMYFWFSLSYLLGRTFILSLYCASINDESKRPLCIFRSVPREYWCTELKRFSDEVNLDSVALTGMKFFRITRSLVISVAGTIVTYELILMQLNKTDKVNDCFE